MIEVQESAVFSKWFEGLRDKAAQFRIAMRIRRPELGSFGDVKPVGERNSELRVAYGPGYRVYLTRRGDTLVILLAGGDKSSQARDIERAKKLARER